MFWLFEVIYIGNNRKRKPYSANSSNLKTGYKTLPDLTASFKSFCTLTFTPAITLINLEAWPKFRDSDKDFIILVLDGDIS